MMSAFNRAVMGNFCGRKWRADLFFFYITISKEAKKVTEPRAIQNL